MHVVAGCRALVDRYRRDRDLMKVLVPREIRIRYRRSILDIAWAVVTPAVVLAVYGVVLTQAFGVEGSCAPYLTSAWTGLVLWTFFATAVGVSVTSLVSSADLVTKIYFPREAIPLSVTAASTVDLVVGAITIAGLILVQRLGVTVSALAVVLPVLVLVIWAAALSSVVAVVAVFIRDVVHAVHLLLRVGFFATPVMYEASVLPRAFAWTADLNPVAVCITATRNMLFCGSLEDVPLLVVHLAIGLVLFVGATLYTRSVESRLVDVV